MGKLHYQLAYPVFLTQITKDVKLCITVVATLAPLLQVSRQQPFLNFRDIQRHDNHSVREEMLLQHVLHLIGMMREALQNKTCGPTRENVEVSKHLMLSGVHKEKFDILGTMLIRFLAKLDEKIVTSLMSVCNSKY